MSTTVFSARFLILAIAILVSAQTGCGRSREPVEKSCKQDNAEACFDLAGMKLRGEGGPKSRNAARSMFSRACSLGHNDACGMAGNLGYAKDDKDPWARRRLKQACRGGQYTSCVRLAWMTLNGEGGPADRDEAARLFEASCKEGVADGCFFAGLIAHDANDQKKAASAIANACELGDAYACKMAGK